MADERQVPPDVTARSLGEIVSDVSEKTSLLVREEIELAKAEVAEKLKSLGRGAAAAAAAGVFLLAALVMGMHALALGINDFLDVETALWAGYLIEAGLFVLIAAIAGLLTYRFFKKGAPPVPEMAIEEAERIRGTLTGELPPIAAPDPQKGPR